MRGASTVLSAAFPPSARRDSAPPQRQPPPTAAARTHRPSSSSLTIMPPRKRARSSPGSSSSSSSAAADAAPLVELDGGEPLPPKLIRLWKAGTLTDVTIQMSADGASFAAHKVVLASGSTYFEGLFQSERSDANAPALAESNQVLDVYGFVAANKTRRVSLIAHIVRR